MRGDLTVVGFTQEIPRRIAASATRYDYGEPVHGLGTLTNGVINTNTFVVAAADTPVIGTHRFGGVFIKNPTPFGTGTLVAHTSMCSCPIADLGRIRGKGEVAANVDTDTEILGLIGDVTLIDYAATGSPTSGPLYTIKDVASANTSGLEIVEGNAAKGTLDVLVEPRAYRTTIS